MADPEPAPPQPEGLEARILAVIGAWKADHIAGGPIARAVDCWNHLEASLQHLAVALVVDLKREL